MRSRTHLTANLGMLFATLIWGSTFIVIQKSLMGSHAIAMMFYRFLLAAVLAAIVLIITKKKPWQHMKEGVVLGLLMCSSYIAQTWGLYYISASDSGFITGLYVILVPLIGFTMGRTKIRYNTLIATVVAAIGLWLITGGVADFKRGEFLTLFCAAIFAVYILVADKYVRRCDIWVLNFQQFFVTAVISLIAMLIFHLPFAVTTSHALYGIIYLAVFANFVAYIIQLRVQQFIAPVTCALILSMEPVFAAAFAWTIGGEHCALGDVIGGLLIIAAIIFAQVFEKRAPYAVKASDSYSH